MKITEADAYKESYKLLTEAASDSIQERLNKLGLEPRFGLVFGSGLGYLASLVKDGQTLNYSDITGFPLPTVKGHDGRLTIGELEGVPLLAFQGRKHYYEVASEPLNVGIMQVVFPVHVLANLGVDNYFATNAAGGVNLGYKPRDIMIINSHATDIPDPLLFSGAYKFKKIDGKDSVIFTAMGRAYDSRLTNMLMESGEPFGDNIHQGFYYAKTGPKYETEAEILDLRARGYGAVGMSTAPEVEVARHRGMNAVALSVITNQTNENGENLTSHEEVTATQEHPQTRERLTHMIDEFFKAYRRLHS